MMDVSLPGAPLVILPDSGTDLLRRELTFAFNELGFAVRRVRPQALADEGSPDYLPRLLELSPALFFSVNLQGLLPGGAVLKTLLASGTPTLAWFVDNPWHVLSGMRDPAWKKLRLAVTDASFIQPLEAALEPDNKVLHLPLAACPYCLEQSREYSLKSGTAFLSAPLGEMVFAGRSSFPGKQAFFAGLNLPPDVLAEAITASGQGLRPDFAWWVEKLGLVAEQPQFWPGKKSRLPGLGAAESNRLWRSACLSALLVSGHNVPAAYESDATTTSELNAPAPLESGTRPPLTLFGDEDWREDLKDNNLDLRPPFDYYARLHPVYAGTPFSLNLNSLLLPAGLSQRAFDIWAAGGFCLSDASPGLDIFPPELTAPVSFSTPGDLLELRDKFRAAPKAKDKLRRAWQAHILAEHTYARRLTIILP